jgi:VanZ family protein
VPSRVSLWGPVALYMALIFALSSLWRPPGVPGRLSDEAGHVVLYFGLGALLVRALAGGWTAVVTVRTAALATLIATLYGASDELHQHFVPFRQMAALDVVADGIGAASAAAVAVARSRIGGRVGGALASSPAAKSARERGV